MKNKTSLFEQIREVDKNGNEFWGARKLAKALEYTDFRNFLTVIGKAKEACKNSGQLVENHLVDFNEEINHGKGAKQEYPSVKLSRYACYLIVQNADPSKGVVAQGQTYFAVQTRLQEIKQMDDYNRLSSEDEKRLFLRNELKKHNTQLADAAKEAGVVNALDYAVKQKFPLLLRLAALLHDVGKPRSRDWENKADGTRMNNGKRGEWTFHQHQYIGEKLVLPAMDRLKFPKKDTEQVALLVREHMFSFDADIGTARGARRFVNRVGQENVEDLMKLRECDRIGSGTKEAVPARLRKFKAMIEIAMKDPISAKTLKINGQDVMKALKIEPGPKVGAVLAVLLENVLDNPKLNDKETLLAEAKKPGKLSDKELADMRAKARKEIEAEQQRIDEGVMAQYGVRGSMKKVK